MEIARRGRPPGSYLAAVLRRIERTLHGKGEDALSGQFVKQVAMARESKNRG